MMIPGMNDFLLKGMAGKSKGLLEALMCGLGQLPGSVVLPTTGNVLLEQQHPKLERISVCLREGREVASCRCRMELSLLLCQGCFSSSFLGVQSSCSPGGSFLVSPALLAPQYVHAERNSEVWITWPLGNDTEQHQRCFQGDGEWENESLGEAFRAGRWQEQARLRLFLSFFPCLGDSSLCCCDLFMAWRRQFALLEEKYVGYGKHAHNFSAPFYF